MRLTRNEVLLLSGLFLLLGLGAVAGSARESPAAAHGRISGDLEAVCSGSPASQTLFVDQGTSFGFIGQDPEGTATMECVNSTSADLIHVTSKADKKFSAGRAQKVPAKN